MLKKYSVRLHEEDVRLLDENYPDLGYTRIVRGLVRNTAERIRRQKKESNRLPSLEELLDDL